jgi:hypothetical protein
VRAATITAAKCAPCLTKRNFRNLHRPGAPPLAACAATA